MRFKAVKMYIAKYCKYAPYQILNLFQIGFFKNNIFNLKYKNNLVRVFI